MAALHCFCGDYSVGLYSSGYIRRAMFIALCLSIVHLLERAPIETLLIERAPVTRALFDNQWHSLRTKTRANLR